MAKYEYWLTEEGLLKIEGWARDGLTNEQISHNMDINPDTLYSWSKKYSEISETLKRGKEIIDRQVENALLKRALGYEYTETRTERFPVEGGMATKTTKTIKEVVPDTTAQIFWLKNRKPKTWRDKQDVELSGGVELTAEHREEIFDRIMEEVNNDDRRPEESS